MILKTKTYLKTNTFGGSSTGPVEQAKTWSMPIWKAIPRIIVVTNDAVQYLSDHKVPRELPFIGKKMDVLKEYVPDGNFGLQYVPFDELEKQKLIVDECLYKAGLNLLRHPSNPKYIHSAFFGYWLRLATLQARVCEEYYRKMCFYFPEILDAVRKEVPLLFQQVS